MQESTLITIQSVLSADPSTEADHRERIIAACNAKHSPKKRRMGTVYDAARILEVHERTVQRYDRIGLLHAIRITRRRVRFDLDEVERLAVEGASH